MFNSIIIIYKIITVNIDAQSIIKDLIVVSHCCACYQMKSN